jgi:hypothetical protein
MPRERSPQEMFEHVARTLCPGEAWQAALSELMGVRRDTVRQLKSGHLSTDHFGTLLDLLIDRQAEMKRIEQELRAWVARQPKEDRT